MSRRRRKSWRWAAWRRYRASKTLAERAAWDFVEKHKSKLGWDLVMINSPFVAGAKQRMNSGGERFAMPQRRLARGTHITSQSYCPLGFGFLWRRVIASIATVMHRRRYAHWASFGGAL
ncbi:hypothetical protein B0H14DRAFT_2557339 [Mycena olivaceomarginata]|nr:hypothetical protein B0H14DRAFT_2557339 [Mycena olivaceomarginata]